MRIRLAIRLIQLAQILDPRFTSIMRNAYKNMAVDLYRKGLITDTELLENLRS